MKKDEAKKILIKKLYNDPEFKELEAAELAELADIIHAEKRHFTDLTFPNVNHDEDDPMKAIFGKKFSGREFLNFISKDFDESDRVSEFVIKVLPKLTKEQVAFCLIKTITLSRNSPEADFAKFLVSIIGGR